MLSRAVDTALPQQQNRRTFKSVHFGNSMHNSYVIINPFPPRLPSSVKVLPRWYVGSFLITQKKNECASLHFKKASGQAVVARHNETTQQLQVGLPRVSAVPLSFKVPYLGEKRQGVKVPD